MLAASGLPRTLREVEVSETRVPVLAAMAAKQWTAGFNPRKVGEAELARIYGMAL